MSLYDFEGTIDGLIERLQGIKEDYPAFTSFGIESGEESGYYNETYTHFDIEGSRLETDEERDTRVEKLKAERAKKKEQKAKEKEEREVRERIEYEKLKEKFGE